MGASILRGAKHAAGPILAVVCLALAVGQAPLEELGRALAGADPGMLAAALLAQVAWMLVRAERWRVLLPGRATFADLFWAQAIGLLGTNVLPLRAGEVVQALALNRCAGVALARVAGSIVLQRLLDLAVLVALLLVLLPRVEMPWAMKLGGLAIAAALGLGIAGLLVVGLLERRTAGLVEAVAARLPARAGAALRKGWGELLAGLGPIRRPGVALWAALLSVLLWGVSILTAWAVIQSIAPGPSALEAMFFIAALAVGIAVPSTPGFVGVFEYVGQQALALPFPERYTPASALAIAVLTHAAAYAAGSLAGLVGLARLGLSFGALRQAEPTAP